MKIIAVSDIHIPKNDAKMPQMINAINNSNAEVLILGGDIAPANDKALENFLASISNFRGLKMYISGNHDLWVADKNSSETSLDRFQKVLPEIYEKYGFYSLERQPLLYKDIGFVGNIGWYDYTFVRTYTPPFGTKFIRLDDNLKPTKQVVNWAQMTQADWKRGFVYIKTLFKTESTGTNDIDYIKGFPDDVVFCNQMREKMEEDIASIESSARKIVAVFHCVPFKEGLIRKNATAVACVRNAWAGSKYLGEILYKHPKVCLALWGHIHERQDIIKGRIKCINMSFSQTGNNPYEIEI